MTSHFPTYWRDGASNASIQAQSDSLEGSTHLTYTQSDSPSAASDQGGV